MSKPEIVRVFFAIDLPAEVKNVLGKYIIALKKKSKSHAIRWTRSENLHITLQFLSQVRVEHLPLLVNNVNSSIEHRIVKSVMRLGKIHLFPNPYRPRVIVLTIESDPDLSELAQAVGEGIQKTAYPIEERPFKAHLTLGRIKQPHGIQLDFLEGAVTPELISLQTDEITLFKSEPQPHGSKYTVIERILI